MKKLSIALICLCSIIFAPGALNAYAFHYTVANNDSYDTMSELDGDSHNLAVPDNWTGLCSFDCMSFLKIELGNFGALQIYNGEIYIRDNFTNRIYQLDPDTGLHTRSISADGFAAGMAILSGTRFSANRHSSILESIKKKGSELILLILNSLILMVWLPTAYICIG